MNKEKIAVIGSGISGLCVSLLLSKKYNVFLFEKNNYLGGHTRTKQILDNDYVHDIDTGFIVFNEENYPDLVEFFKYLNIATVNSDMSFSVSINNPDFEYSGSSLNGLFSQRKHIFSLTFLLFLRDILKFYKKCQNTSIINDFKEYTLEDFLNKFNYSQNLRKLHIYPMVSSIWSSNNDEVRKFPFISFVNFFKNHGLFSIVNRPKWKFVKRGSYRYVESIIKKNLFQYHTNKEVFKIVREKSKIRIILKNNVEFIVDKVILATHADQALNLIERPSTEEKNILSKFKYSNNYAYLHSDVNLMPKRRSTWSSWNFQGNSINDEKFTLTYWMNKLQKLEGEKNFFVTINSKQLPNSTYDQTNFEHIIFDLETVEAQKKILNIQGKMNTYFCGSYCGFGFHEDGIQSAAFLAKLFGIELPWRRNSKFQNRLAY